ncbi:MAG: hypothetical protein LBT75_01860 [Bacilli bacterium]|jgi:hypothetical protein|nr:hypothetical protein [Bacilli bacterium]
MSEVNLDEIIKSLLHNDINNMLMFSDDNVLLDSTYEIELIGLYPSANIIRFIDINAFINKSKKPLYYKYNCLFINKNYVKYLQDIKYYFEENDFYLILILNKNFEYDNNNELFKIFNDKRYRIKLIDFNNDIIALISK